MQQGAKPLAAGADPDSIVLIEDGKLYEHSTAALRIARRLSGLWPALYYLFIWVRRPIRNWVYRFIARNRYRWFGKADACRMPTPALKARFLRGRELIACRARASTASSTSSVVSFHRQFPSTTPGRFIRAALPSASRLHWHDRDAARSRERRADQIRRDVVGGGRQIDTHTMARRLVELLPPADYRVVVVGARITKRIRWAVAWMVQVEKVAVEAELQHAHPG